MAKNDIGIPPLPPPDNSDPVDTGDPNVPITPDDQRFIEEYLVDLDPIRAMRVIQPLLTWRMARDAAREIMARVNIRSEIAAARRAQIYRTRTTADNVIRELARVAFSDILDLFDPVTLNLRHPRHIPLETRRAIASIKVNRERRTVRFNGRTRTTITEQEVEYKLWPKMEALDKLTKHLGLDVEITPLDALLNALPPDLATAVRLQLSNASAADSTGHRMIGSVDDETPPPGHIVQPSPIVNETAPQTPDAP